MLFTPYLAQEEGVAMYPKDVYRCMTEAASVAGSLGGSEASTDLKDLTSRENETLQRIMGEPESLMT